MPRTVSVLAGLLAVATITYKFRDDLMANTNDIRRRLDDAKTTLDHVAAGTASQSQLRSQSSTPSRSFIGESQHYVSNRLVPTGKFLIFRFEKREGWVGWCFFEWGGGVELFCWLI